MRENRTYGSDGGEAHAFPTPIEGIQADRESRFRACEGIAQLKIVIRAKAGISMEFQVDRDSRFRGNDD